MFSLVILLTYLLQIQASKHLTASIQANSTQNSYDVTSIGSQSAFIGTTSECASITPLNLQQATRAYVSWTVYLQCGLQNHEMPNLQFLFIKVPWILTMNTPRNSMWDEWKKLNTERPNLQRLEVFDELGAGTLHHLLIDGLYENRIDKLTELIALDKVDVNLEDSFG